MRTALGEFVAVYAVRARPASAHSTEVEDRAELRDRWVFGRRRLLSRSPPPAGLPTPMNFLDRSYSLRDPTMRSTARPRSTASDFPLPGSPNAVGRGCSCSVLGNAGCRIGADRVPAGPGPRAVRS